MPSRVQLLGQYAVFYMQSIYMLSLIIIKFSDYVHYAVAIYIHTYIHMLTVYGWQWTEKDSACNFRAAPGSVVPLSSPNGSTSCHDEVDFSLCFEDTAILYGICLTFWVLAGLSFFRGNGLRPKLDFGPLHASKLVGGAN